MKTGSNPPVWTRKQGNARKKSVPKTGKVCVAVNKNTTRASKPSDGYKYEIYLGELRPFFDDFVYVQEYVVGNRVYLKLSRVGGGSYQKHVIQIQRSGRVGHNSRLAYSQKMPVRDCKYVLGEYEALVHIADLD